MTEQIEMPEESLAPRGVGPQLRIAREKLGLTIEQVAAETRISQRYIQSIEEGDFNALPGSTYAVGFARNIAKVVQLDQADVAAMVRAELGAIVPDHADKGATFEPGDSARGPSGRLVWFSLFAAALLMAGLFVTVRMVFSPAAELPSLIEQQEAQEAEALAARQVEEQGPATADAIAANGPVVFTAEGPTWVRFYDAQRRVLMEKEMAEGESYTIPADADGPQIITARPNFLAITIGGQAVPRLSQEQVTVQNVPVDAASLLARTAPPAVGERQALANQ